MLVQNNSRGILLNDCSLGYLVDAWAYKRLPKSFALRLDKSFAENLLTSHLTLAFKTFTPEPATLTRLVEKVLLVWSTEWILHPAAANSLSQEIDDFLDIIGRSDYELLSMPVVNGINQPIGSTLPFGIEHWFTSYERPLDVTHPFTWPSDKAFWYHNWPHLSSSSK